jgi:hypothetical protein
MSKNMVEPEGPQMVILRRVAWWINKATRAQAHASSRALTPIPTHPYTHLPRSRARTHTHAYTHRNYRTIPLLHLWAFMASSRAKFTSMSWGQPPDWSLQGCSRCPWRSFGIKYITIHHKQFLPQIHELVIRNNPVRSHSMFCATSNWRSAT